MRHANMMQSSLLHSRSSRLAQGIRAYISSNMSCFSSVELDTIDSSSSFIVRSLVLSVRVNADAGVNCDVHVKQAVPANLRRTACLFELIAMGEHGLWIYRFGVPWVPLLALLER